MACCGVSSAQATVVRFTERHNVFNVGLTQVVERATCVERQQALAFGYLRLYPRGRG